MKPVLIVTSDPAISDQLEGLVSAQDLHAETLPAVTSADSMKWAGASVVLIDTDQAHAAVDLPGRSDGLVVIFDAATTTDDACTIAEKIGAPYAAQIPLGVPWLTTHIALRAATADALI